MILVLMKFVKRVMRPLVNVARLRQVARASRTAKVMKCQLNSPFLEKSELSVFALVNFYSNHEYVINRIGRLAEVFQVQKSVQKLFMSIILFMLKHNEP